MLYLNQSLLKIAGCGGTHRTERSGIMAVAAGIIGAPSAFDCAGCGKRAGDSD